MPTPITLTFTFTSDAQQQQAIAALSNIFGYDASQGNQIEFLKHAIAGDLLAKIQSYLSMQAANAAQAQIKAEHPRNCVMNVGPTQMMFSAFQEKGDEIFCTNISDIGPTMLIFDARQPELRDMTVEVRIVRNTGQKDWRDDLVPPAHTARHLPVLAEVATQLQWLSNNKHLPA